MADRKISDLTALTTPAAGDYLPIVDISEPSNASKNKRITIEELFRGVPLGTAAAPSIAIEGDEDTGIYSPGANQLAISTNGTGRLFVDANGNVGIGATNSLSELLVAGSNPSIYIKPNADTETSELVFRNAANAQSRGFVAYNHSDESMAFRVNLSERLRITSAGLVGIGTTSPTVLLDCSGTGSQEIRLSTFTSGDTRLGMSIVGATYNWIDSERSSSAMKFGVGNAERMRIDSSGRLLVGTSSDSGGALLQVNGNRVRIATAKTPASASDTGTTGEVCWDASYIYVCTATDTWKRAALSTW